MAINNKNVTELKKPSGMTDAAWMSYLSTARASDHVANGYITTTIKQCCDDAVQACGDHDADAIAYRLLLAKAVSKTALTTQDTIDTTAYELRLKAKGLL